MSKIIKISPIFKVNQKALPSRRREFSLVCIVEILSGECG